jgi:alpha-tubulin suppressor-like RCC1 family protein
VLNHHSLIVLIKGFEERKITSIACGANHSIALDEEGYVYSWGFGGLGRLGHSEQKDLYRPKVISNLAGTHRASRATKIACGASCSVALDGNQQMLLWGKWKTTGVGSTGQPWMSPRYLYDLNGWNLRQVAAGGSSLFALAEEEKTTIAWGQVLNGELGFGEDASKTATKPQKVEPLEGIRSIQ